VVGEILGVKEGSDDGSLDQRFVGPELGKYVGIVEGDIVGLMLGRVEGL